MSSPAPGSRRNQRNAQFHELFGRLPARIQVLARQKFQLFLTDPAHRSLRVHRLQDTSRPGVVDDSFSVSINMQYRAIYCVVGDTNVWYWIGSHAEYDTLLGC